LEGGEASVDPAADYERIRRGKDLEHHTGIGPPEMRIPKHEREPPIGTE
jgi:hypothetical protein